jgi:tRNA(fMet)-specific endonuclease VapC
MVNTQGYLFDTNIVIGLLTDEPECVSLLQKLMEESEPIFFSVVTYCEVLSGMDSELVLRKKLKLLNEKRCLNVDVKIARMAGLLRRHLRSKGRKLKTPDALIITTAQENNLGIVSKDKDMNFITEELGIPLIKP